MPPAPRACFFGLPQMGSWKIRAQQVARARPHWTSRAALEPDDILGHDVFVAIKRPFRQRLRLLHGLGKVVCYDILDCWRQPQDDLQHDDLPKIRRHFESFLADLPVSGVIFPNRQMLLDLGDLVPNGICIYHHFWPGMEPIVVREQARIVGYQGEAHYLGPWQAAIERACRKLGLQFVVNPKDLRSIDIGLAARGGAHGSLLARRYKSNVKLANFYGAAIPCLVNDADLSYRETDDGEVRFFATEAELEARLEELLPYETRLRVHASFVRTRERFTPAAIAGEYERYFARLLANKSLPV